MKRTINLLICVIIIMASMCTIASAASDGLYAYEVNGVEYTVEIDDASISNEKKLSIANSLIGANENEIMTVNIWCDLFGHDYQYTTASVVQHKVNVYAPRCEKKSYDVTYCEDCDYTEQTLKAINCIDCCPED